MYVISSNFWANYQMKIDPAMKYLKTFLKQSLPAFSLNALLGLSQGSISLYAVGIPLSLLESSDIKHNVHEPMCPT